MFVALMAFLMVFPGTRDISTTDTVSATCTNVPLKNTAKMPLIFPTPTPLMATITGTVRIRSGPGISFGTVGFLNVGDTIQVLGCTGNWIRMPKGYINSRYTDKKCHGTYNNSQDR